MDEFGFNDDLEAQLQETLPLGDLGGGSEREGFDPDLYKNYRKTGGTGRFIALRPWFEGGKISVDIGETNESGGSTSLRSNTKVWAPMPSLSTFLTAVRDGHGPRLYPETFDRNNKRTAPETFVYYGGGNSKSGPISRILKIAYWMQGDTEDPTAFVWKAGHFAAKTSGTGAFIPDMTKQLSANTVKVSRAEMAEIATLLNLALVHHASTSTDWLKEITGKKRDK